MATDCRRSSREEGDGGDRGAEIGQPHALAVAASYGRVKVVAVVVMRTIGRACHAV